MTATRHTAQGHLGSFYTVLLAVSCVCVPQPPKMMAGMRVQPSYTVCLHLAIFELGKAKFLSKNDLRLSHCFLLLQEQQAPKGRATDSSLGFSLEMKVQASSHRTVQTHTATWKEACSHTVYPQESHTQLPGNLPTSSAF